MNAPYPKSRFRQQGMVTVLAVIFLITAVIFALSQTLNITGSNSIDNSQQMDSTAAFFLAESGVERAQATITSAAEGGSYTEATCCILGQPSCLTTGGLPSGNINLGRGFFQYTSALSTPELCGRLNPSCTDCTVTVQGTIGSSSRSIRTQLLTTETQGVAGHGAAFNLNLTSTADESGAFTNLAYRAKDAGGGGNASVSSCNTIVPPDGESTACASLWNLVGTGASNVSGMGVYDEVPTIGVYNILYLLSAPRHFALIGILLNPTSGRSVGNVGSYGADTGSNRTASTSRIDGSLPANWNCALNSGTASASHAAGADTLVYGFSSLAASGTGELNGVSFGPASTPLQNQQLYMKQIATLSGDPDPNLSNKFLYSKIWYAHNTAYYSTGATAATNGADFVGTIGAPVRGRRNAGNNRFVLDENVTGGVLSVGDIIKNSSDPNPGTITYGTLGSLAVGTANQANAQYNYTDTSGLTPTSNTNFRAYSTVLRLATATCAGTLTLNDDVTNAGDATIYGPLNTPPSSGTINAAGSTYTLSGGSAATYYVTTASTTCGSGNGNVNMHSAGTTITLSGNVTGGVPSVGTAIAVPVGNGVFDSAALTGSISGTTLTVTSCSNGTPSVGDALFGKNVRANTRITGPFSGAPCNGTYPVTPSPDAGSGPIVARAAVLTAALANSYVASRKPTIRLSATTTNPPVNAQICGGVCAFFFGNAGSQTNFNLFNIATGLDWSSGFACLSGVDPDQLVPLVRVVAERTSWSEPVQPVQ